jgi:segregation and condensation protein B
MSENELDSTSPNDDQIDDIELAYRAALVALDAAEEQVGSAFADMATEDPAPSDDEASAASGLSIGQQLADDLSEQQSDVAAAATDELVDGFRRVTPSQVVEAAVFVGGDVALTARKLASLVGRDVSARVAVSLIDSLNLKYERENRPYEIRLHEGGYALELREQFNDISVRVFGMGPRDVRLSAEVLEVLAFVAYNQPVSKQQLTDIDRANTMTLLRQLIRLQLVELSRSGSGRGEVSYSTTDRFLQVFGLKSIEELPTADIFDLK